VTQPRNDVAVKVDEWKMPPFMGLTSWAAFQAGKKESAMVMGDLVLFEDEVMMPYRADMSARKRASPTRCNVANTEAALSLAAIFGLVFAVGIKRESYFPFAACFNFLMSSFTTGETVQDNFLKKPASRQVREGREVEPIFLCALRGLGVRQI